MHVCYSDLTFKQIKKKQTVRRVVYILWVYVSETKVKYRSCGLWRLMNPMSRHFHLGYPLMSSSSLCLFLSQKLFI